MRLRLRVLLVGVLLPLIAAGCDSPAATADAADARGPDRAAPDARRDGPVQRDRGVDGAPLGDGAPPVTYVEARGVAHVHTIYSKDGCDGKGFVGGVPDTACVNELRAAACANKLDFVMLTDHPSHMADYTLQENLLYSASAGDQLVLHQGNTVANKVTCSSGHQVLFSVGFEAMHLMPLGLHSKPASGSDLYNSIYDTTDPAQAQARVTGLKNLGAVVSVVHSEESDISAKTIVAAGYDAMEWYNIHASLTGTIGPDLLTFDPQKLKELTTLVKTILGMSDFFSGGSSKPHADLAYLELLELLPQAGFSKWKEVLRSRRITGLLGTDVHRNVSVDSSVCSGSKQVTCLLAFVLVEGLLGVSIPAGVSGLLLSGGHIVLNDGVRLDSYARMTRWLQNRVLVTAIEPIAIQEGLRKGRLLGVWTVFGDPHGFSYTALQGANVLRMGDTAKGAMTIKVSAPDMPVAMGGASFSSTEALLAEIRTRVLRTDSTGTTQVQETTTRGALISLPVTAAGAYHVEVRIKPKHLASALGSKSSLADSEYLWVITNPVYLVP